MNDTTRRQVLKLSGATIAATAAGVGTASAESSPWEAVKSPVDVTLHDVATTARNDFTVGGGVVVERTDLGWRTVVEDGPASNGRTLYGADVTDDGERLWFVGASGAIGEYDVETGSLVDRSAPNDATNNFRDVAVAGPAGDANVYVAGDSGSVYYSFENGASGTWNDVAVGQGAAIEAIDFHGGRAGHLVNGNAKVFYTEDGTTWNRTGIADADVSLYGVDSDGKEDVWVAAGSGVVYRYRPDDGGTPKWFRTSVSEPALRDIEVESGAGYTVGDAGAVFERADGSWSRDETPTEQGLEAVVRTDSNDVAVGASGTILETNPDDDADPGSGDGDAGRIRRRSTETGESESLTFALENVGEQRVTVESFALETNVQVATMERSGAEVTLDGNVEGVADAADGFPVDDQQRSLDQQAAYEPGTIGTADFGRYDGGNVELTVEPAAEKPNGDYVGAALSYGDGTSETFYFAVTNVNS